MRAAPTRGSNHAPQAQVRPEAGRPAPTYQYSWKVTIKLLSLDPGEMKFDVDWQRSDVQGTAEQPVAGGHRAITLREGERHVLDFINAPSHSFEAVNLE